MLFLIICFLSHGQGSLEDKIYSLKQKPILKEKVFIHTNKTSYFPEDTIWFKAYVGYATNNPAKETTKLYVNLLNSSGKIIRDRKVLIEEGTGQGEFVLSSDVGPGNYYIQAYTNYMGNFGEDYYYLQRVTVLGNTNMVYDQSNTKYDIKLLPESGYLLESVENVIGVKAMINGKGVDFSGKIVDNDGETVVNFSNEHLGMTRCKLPYKAGARYIAKISLNDTLIKIHVPQAIKKGIVLNTDNSDNTYLRIVLRTNDISLDDPVNSNYTLLFHQNHQIYGLVSIAKIDSTVATIKTEKNVFLDGINTITLFKDEKPIAQRNFFVEKEQKKVKTDLNRLLVENDSITYKLRLSIQDMPIEANLSVSVLSEETMVYAEKQNLRSTFLLTSHVKGDVENPAYYLNPINKNRHKHLDLLLLTQGWSRYTLKEMIQELNPRPRFGFEHGFELEGVLEGRLQHDRLALIADNYQIIDEVNLNKNRNFSFKNLLLFKGDTVKVSYLNERGKFIKPDSLRFEDKPQLSIPLRLPEKSRLKILNSEAEEAKDEQPLIYENGTIVLEGVTLTDKKLRQRMLERRKIIEKYKSIIADIGKYYDMPIAENSKEQDLMLFLRTKEGVRVVSEGVENYLVKPNKQVLLFIDGQRIESEQLLSVSINMKDVENIMVNNESSRSIYSVFSKKSTIPPFNEHIVKNGYDIALEYYTPLYTFNNNQFSDWIEIDWKPTLKTNEKGEVLIKVPKGTRLQNYLFSIQGFSESGHLISKLLRE